MSAYFFGCWNESGHFLFAPGGQRPYREEDAIVYYGKRLHLDGTLAPRRDTRQWRETYGKLCWNGQDEQIRCYSEEYPQGMFLRHVLDNGYTAIQWWDRCQGDTRGACNSTVLMKGEHASAEMLEALALYFPHVLENLKQAGVQLVEVLREEAER